ncbi:MAG: hypothetical protein LBB09_02590 [Rickettsiales bacterium]|jgi:hypothetical protein|nr:hypothetical protein [Rickettsiales bacterium]
MQEKLVGDLIEMGDDKSSSDLYLEKKIECSTATKGEKLGGKAPKLFNEFRFERENLNFDNLMDDIEKRIGGKTPSFFWKVKNFIDQSGYVKRFNEAAEKIWGIPTKLKILFIPNCRDEDGNLLPEEELNKIFDDYGLKEENAYGIYNRELTEVRPYVLEKIGMIGMGGKTPGPFPGIYYKEGEVRRDADVVELDYYMNRPRTLHTFYHETCHIMQGKDWMAREPVFSKYAMIDRMGNETQANLYANMCIALQLLQCGQLTQDMVNSLLECSSCDPEGFYNDMVISHRYLTDILQNPEKYEDFFLKNGEINIEILYKHTKEIVFEEQTKIYNEYYEPLFKLEEKRILCAGFLKDCVNTLKPKELERLQIFLTDNIAEARKTKEGRWLTKIPEDPSMITPELCEKILSGENALRGTVMIQDNKYMELINGLGKIKEFEAYAEEYGVEAEKKANQREKKIIKADNDLRNPATQDREKGKKIEPRNSYRSIMEEQQSAVIDGAYYRVEIQKAEGEKKQKLEEEQKKLESEHRTSIKNLLLLEKEKQRRAPEQAQKQPPKETASEKEARVEENEAKEERKEGQKKPDAVKMKEQVKNLEEIIGQANATKTINPALGFETSLK